MKSKKGRSKKTIKREDGFFVYIVRCRDGAYYTGYTNDLESRITLHNRGDGAKYLKSKLPVKLVYAKEYRYYKNALRRERNIKKMTRRQKEELIRIYNDNKKQNQEALGAPTDLSPLLLSEESEGDKSKRGSTHV
jgi:putative endonuclease